MSAYKLFMSKLGGKAPMDPKCLTWYQCSQREVRAMGVAPHPSTSEKSGYVFYGEKKYWRLLQFGSKRQHLIPKWFDNQLFGLKLGLSPTTFWTITKEIKTFSWGGFSPPDPPFKSAAVAASASQVRTLEPSGPLARPPGVGSTWSMVWNVDYRTARSSPARPAGSGIRRLGWGFRAKFGPDLILKLGQKTSKIG